MDRWPDEKCAVGLVSAPPKKKFFKIAFPNGRGIEN